MADIKLDFHGRDYVGLADYGERVGDATAGNPDFPVASTRVSGLQGKVSTLRAKIKARDAHEQTGKQITLELRNAEKDLRDELKSMGSLAHGEVRGDATKLTGGGWDLTDEEGKPQGTLPAPADFAVTYGDEFRELDFMFDPVKGAKTYKLQRRLQGTADWTSLDIPRGTKFSLTDQPAGALEFRLCAGGTDGDGEWSPIISKKLG